MRLTYLPHARRRMEERGISEEEVETVLEAPALEYLGNLGRTLAERILLGRRLAVKVVYNLAELIDQAAGSLEVPEQLKRRPTTRTSPP
jgi:hypothetical protein